MLLYLPGLIRLLKYRGQPALALADLRSPLVVFYSLETIAPAQSFNFTAINETSIAGKLETRGNNMKYVQFLDLWDCVYFPALPELWFLLIAFAVNICLLLLMLTFLALKWARLLLTLLTMMDFLGLVFILWRFAFIDGNVSSFVSKPKLINTKYQWLKYSQFTSKYTFGFYIFIFTVILIHGVLAFLVIRNVNYAAKEKLIHQL